MRMQLCCLLLFMTILTSIGQSQPPLPPLPGKLPPGRNQQSSEANAELPALLQTLRQGAEQKKLEAIEKLRHVAGAAREKITALGQSLQSESDAVRLSALEAISELDQRNPELLASVRQIAGDGKSQFERILASRAALQMSDDPSTRSEMIGELLDGLKSEDPAVANQSAAALRQAGASADAALIEALNAKNPLTRSLAAQILGDSGADVASDKLLFMLQDSSVMVRASAIDAIGNQKASKESVTALTDILSSEDSPSLQARVVNALGKSGADNVKVMELLAKVAKSSGPTVALTCVRSISDSQIDAAQKAGILGEILSGADPALSAEVTAALVEAGDAGVDTLTKALLDPASRYWAVIGLSDIGEDASGATETMVNVLDTSTPDIQTEILLALANIKPNANAIAAAVAQQLRSQHVAVRYAAALTAVRTQLSDASTIAALQENSNSDDEMLSLVSLYAIARISPDRPAAGFKAVAALGRAIRSKDKRLAQLAAIALKDLKQ